MNWAVEIRRRDGTYEAVVRCTFSDDAERIYTAYVKEGVSCRVLHDGIEGRTVHCEYEANDE